MGYDLRKAALIGCCLLALIVGTAFFPAAGFDDFPNTEAVDDGYYEADRDVPGSGFDGDDTGAETDDASSDADADADDSSADDGSGAGDADDDATDGDDGTDDSSSGDGGSDESNRPDDGSDDDGAGDTDGSGETSNAFLTAGSALVFAVVVLALTGFLWRATDPTRDPAIGPEDLPDGFIPRLQLRLRRIPQASMTATIGIARGTTGVLDMVGKTGSVVFGGLRYTGSNVSNALGGLARGVPAGLSALGATLAGVRLPSLVTGLESLLGGIGRTRSTDTASWGATDDGPSSSSGQPPIATAKRPQPQTVEAAWEAMTDRVVAQADDPETKTPREYAHRAIEQGLPEHAVNTLTETFCQVRYGGYSASSDRLRRALESYDEIAANDTPPGETS